MRASSPRRSPANRCRHRGPLCATMGMPVRTVIERGPKGKGAVAFSVDWPGRRLTATPQPAALARSPWESGREGPGWFAGSDLWTDPVAGTRPVYPRVPGHVAASHA